MQITASTATVLREGNEIKINIAEVDLNEVIVVKPGEKIPLDGKIIVGEA